MDVALSFAALPVCLQRAYVRKPRPTKLARALPENFSQNNYLAEAVPRDLRPAHSAASLGGGKAKGTPRGKAPGRTLHRLRPAQPLDKTKGSPALSGAGRRPRASGQLTPFFEKQLSCRSRQRCIIFNPVRRSPRPPRPFPQPPPAKAVCTALPRLARAKPAA